MWICLYTIQDYVTYEKLSSFIEKEFVPFVTVWLHQLWKFEIFDNDAGVGFVYN